jgi:MFS family permease
MTGEPKAARTNRGAFAILFGVSVATAMGNTGMLSVLPAIGRQIGIPDALVAGIFSLSAVLWAITSPLWARQSDLRGRKPLILLGLTGFCVSMTLCAWWSRRACITWPADGDLLPLPAVARAVRACSARPPIRPPKPIWPSGPAARSAPRPWPPWPGRLA